jgi:hypothetical protein
MSSALAVLTIFSHTMVLTVNLHSAGTSNPIQRAVVIFVLFGHTPQLEELMAKLCNRHEFEIGIHENVRCCGLASAKMTLSGTGSGPMEQSSNFEFQENCVHAMNKSTVPPTII